MATGNLTSVSLLGSVKTVKFLIPTKYDTSINLNRGTELQALSFHISWALGSGSGTVSLAEGNVDDYSLSVASVDDGGTAITFTLDATAAGQEKINILVADVAEVFYLNFGAGITSEVEIYTNVNGLTGEEV